jgi:RHS repeat-associated protein
METKVGTRKARGRAVGQLLLALFVVVCCWVVDLGGAQAQAQSTPASTARTCNYPGASPCPSPPPMPGPWNYSVNPHYDSYFPNGLVHSFADVDYYYQLKFQGGGWCTSTNAGRVLNYTRSTDYGIVYGEDYTFTYNDTAYSYQNGSTPPCGSSWTTDATVDRNRSVGCEPGTTLFYQANPQIGPFCLSQGNVNNVLKQVGYCKACNGGPANGRQVAGDPIDVSNSNVFVGQTDYEASSGNSLRFARSYNSLGVAVVPWGGVQSYQLGSVIMGSGWTATYFQSLTPMSVTDSNGAHSAIYAFRPDGRVLTFVLYNGVYSPDGDVEDSLIQTPDGGFQYQTGDDTIESYDATGRLLSLTPRGKSAVTIGYGTHGGLPVTVSDAFGHALQFDYITDSGGVQRLGSLTDPSGGTIKYAYDWNGNLSSVTYQDGSQRQYTYGPTSTTLHNLTSIVDESSVTYQSWSYNNAYAIGSQLAGGVNSYSVAYNGNSTAVTDPLGQVRSYPNQQTIWGSVRMTSVNVLNPGTGEDKARAYDANGNITSRTDFNGNVTSYSYDVIRNLETSRTEAAGTPLARTISTTWDINWRKPDQVVEPYRTTTLAYDAMGNMLTNTVTDTTVSPHVSRKWTYTYDSYGRVLTEKGPRTDVNSTVTYAYYTCTAGFECGELRTRTDAAGNVITYNSYNEHGLPLSITDANGVVTTLIYDSRMHLLSTSTQGETTKMSWYPTGLLQSVTLPDSSYIRYAYDGAHRLTQVTDGAGNSLQYALDSMGNHIAESAYDPNNVLSRAVSRVYSTLNQLYQTVGSRGTADVTTTYGYDSNGNDTTVSAPLARNTTKVFDALNRLSKITDAKNGNTILDYDIDDNLTGVQNPSGLTTTYLYDGLGEVVQETSPATGVTINTYDLGGNLLTRQDARQITTHYTYDAMNRITKAAYGDQTLQYSYDAGMYGKGRLTTAWDSNQSLSWTYDALGRVTSKTQTIGELTLGIGYSYSQGNVATMTTPSGQVVSYTYNDHLISSIAVNGVPVLTNVSYEPFGPVRGWTWGNGSVETRLSDTDGSASQITGAETTTYTVDSASRIVGMSNASQPALSWQFGYDALDRVTGASTDSTNLGWTFDSDGNRSGQTGGNAPSYSATSLALGYNNSGRLITVNTSAGVSGYLYDAMGHRVEKTSSTGSTVFVYDEDGHLLGEYDGSGHLIEETLWLGGIAVATLRPSGSSGVNAFYVHVDHLGSPKAVTRPTDNAIVWRWDQDPYGTAAPDQNPSGFGVFFYNVRFPGQYYDVESGLVYNGARYYDQQSGRFIQSDPIGLDGGSYSTYAYANGNPLTFSDPTGLVPNPAEATCLVDPVQPICWSGVIADVLTWGAAGAAGAAALATPGDTSVHAEGYVDNPQAAAEWAEYKEKYAQPPPPDLDECELLNWKLRREKNLLQARRAWDAKWWPGRHDAAIAQSEKAIKNLKDKIQKAGCTCPDL